MAVANQTDTIYAGNKRTLRFAITDEDTVGSPAFDLTGLTLKFALARVSASGSVLTKTPVFQKTTAAPSELVITNAAGGLCEVYLVGADTSALLGDFYFELEAFESGGQHVVLATGTLTILPNVSNP